MNKALTSTVRIVGDKTFIETLGSIGVPSQNAGVTDILELLEETSEHYIVLVPHDDTRRAIKIAKSHVQSILFIEAGSANEFLDQALERSVGE